MLCIVSINHDDQIHLVVKCECLWAERFERKGKASISSVISLCSEMYEKLKEINDAEDVPPEITQAVSWVSDLMLYIQAIGDTTVCYPAAAAVPARLKSCRDKYVKMILNLFEDDSETNIWHALEGDWLATLVAERQLKPEIDKVVARVERGDIDAIADCVKALPAWAKAHRKGGTKNVEVLLLKQLNALLPKAPSSTDSEAGDATEPASMTMQTLLRVTKGIAPAATMAFTGMNSERKDEMRKFEMAANKALIRVKGAEARNKVLLAMEVFLKET